MAETCSLFIYDIIKKLITCGGNIYASIHTSQHNGIDSIQNYSYLCRYTGWSRSLCAPDDNSTKNTQKYFKQFQSLTTVT
jgi:hypothetical protein